MVHDDLFNHARKSRDTLAFTIICWHSDVTMHTSHARGRNVGHGCRVRCASGRLQRSLLGSLVRARLSHPDVGSSTALDCQAPGNVRIRQFGESVVVCRGKEWTGRNDALFNAHYSRVVSTDADGTWQPQPEHVLSGHGDWVRDVAWAPNVGLPCSYIASCSQVGCGAVRRPRHCQSSFRHIHPLPISRTRR